MYFDFLNILALATIFAGVVWVVDDLWCAGKRRSGATGFSEQKKYPIVIEYSRSLFPVLLIVLLIRAFLIQPYRVPTGSLEPTIMPGDMILVNQYDYGLRLPIWNKELIHVREPKTGEIALFRWPVSPGVTFVKRVIGVPGDHISYINKMLYVNGKPATQARLNDAMEMSDNGSASKVQVYEEVLAGVKHRIYIRPDRPAEDFKNLVVPVGTYFMMGDNRDDSDDSRSWGFVPSDDFIGRGILIFMSWDSNAHRVRWDRIGQSLQK
ncbi:MAG: signal peptidase I [Coxiella sp. RIFCSPHIGHO2_12_FULL_44_14]|nr:MAG: signal peptidase I [Coxiella sp. RIFCSPHIGHO2_12_FULL_44_14]